MKYIIKKAEHYIYIENQFFITKTSEGDPQIKNEIAQLLLDKIFESIEKKKKFRVIIIIPFHVTF
jgi:phospholipase D1/2